MALIDVITQVNLTLTALNPAVSIAFGPAELNRRAQPPMVTWVPTSDSFEVGGEHHTGTNKAAGRVIAMCLAGCEAHIWGAVSPQSGEDYSATWALLTQVINALRGTVKARDMVLASSSGRWVDVGGAQSTSYGRSYVFSFAVRLPIVEVASTGATTVLTAVPTTNTILYPDAQLITNP